MIHKTRVCVVCIGYEKVHLDRSNIIEKNRKDACFQNFWKMSVFFFYSKEKEKLKTEDYRDFIDEKHLNGSSHAMKVKII